MPLEKRRIQALKQENSLHRKVVEKIITATQKGRIVWEHSAYDPYAEFYGDLNGWRLRARWLQDETGLTLTKYRTTTTKMTIDIGGKDMCGLREAIYAQPDIAAVQKARNKQRLSTASKDQKAKQVSEQVALNDFLKS